METTTKTVARHLSKFNLLILLSVFSFSNHANDWLPAPLQDFSGVVVPALSVDSLPYKDVDTQVNPSLLIMGRIDKLFIEGNRVGYMLTRTDFGALSVIGQSRTHQYIPEDEGLATRDKSLELGFQLAKPLAEQWTAQLTFFTDISDTHTGQEFELGVYRRDFWDDFRMLTLFAVQQQTKELTNYYAGFGDYQADADLNAEIEWIGVYQLTNDINITAVYRHYLHGDGLANSPLVDNDQTQKIALGVGWSF